jgi:fucose 4-O-acetylase-like acetyltransferase
MVAAIAVAYLWVLRPGGTTKWSPLQQLGRTSLFIYWIHVEMVYGLISLPLHKRLSWTESWIALALFSLFMLGCSVLKDRVMGKSGARS